MNSYRSVVILLVGVVLAISFYVGGQGHLFGTEPDEPTPAVAPAAGTDTIPWTIGFLSRPLVDRYPIYFCLEDTAGGSWTQDDHDAAADGISSAYGWGKVNRTVLTQVQERCNEMPRVSVRFVMDSAFVQEQCQPGTPFTVVACVSFHDWVYLPEAGMWSYGTAVVHTEPYWWVRLSHAVRAGVLIHEFGHAGLALGDTPAQACGVTVMDYTYPWSCGMLPYPRPADVVVTDALYGSYKDPAWFCGIGGCPQRKR